MAIDWEAKVGAPNVAVFGEAATFTPASGAPAFPVTGVFDNQFRATVVIDGDGPSTDSLPVFGINAAQFLPTSDVPTKVAPVQSDRITFPSGPMPHSGKSFLVMEPRPDSHGIYHLALNEAA